MTRAEKMLKGILARFVVKSDECIPESNLKQIQDMYATLPERPKKGKVAPVWKNNKTAGTNGENTS